MFKLTEKEIKAVEDSIVHWEKDIKGKFEKGLHVLDNYRLYNYATAWSDGTRVKMYSYDCPLCILFRNCDTENICVMCPFFKKYNTKCVTKEWRDFYTTPTLENCNKMIDALRKILE